MGFPRSVLIAVLLVLMMSFVNSSQAFAQTPSPADSDWPTKPAKKIQKLDLLYHASEAYLAVGTGLDMMTTVHNLGHPTTAYSNSGAFLTHYYAVETGWSAPIVGSRDTTGVVVANVLVNAGIDLLDRRLYQRGGKWKFVAVSLNVLKGTGNIVCGIRNIRTNEGIDQVVRMRTGYKGAVIWSR